LEESRELRALRAMAWERAKGELYAMLHTYYGSNASHARMLELIEDLIDKVEGEYLCE